jgi:hypothetical protein
MSILVSVLEWASSPRLMRAVNGWLALFWLAMVPVSLATGWIYAIAFVSAVSIYANFVTHWANWQAARVEVHQTEEAA